MKRRYVVILGLLGGLTALSAPAMIPAEVEIDSGPVQGTSGRSPDVRVFKGIPYAAPPVGENRWRPPQPPPSRDTALRTAEFGPRCIQGAGAGPNTSEDCLYLNVWTTADTAEDRLPVMVWFHGGALTVGSGSEPRYDGEALARRGVIVVTLNYRLGPFGFFAHPGLSAESEHGVSGNYGFLDSLAALEWVKRNIAAFGGDPDNVTVFGESAGARITGTLVGSPAADGLFDRAILQSGSWMGLGMSRMETLDEAERAGQRVAAELEAESIAELRAVSPDALLSASPGASMVVDGRLIPEDLSERFAAGEQNDVDMLIGSNKDEGTFFIRDAVHAEEFLDEVNERFGEKTEEFLSLYPANSDGQAHESALASFTDETAWLVRTIAGWHAAAGNRTYTYYFTRVPPAPRPELGATHVADVAYMFDHVPATAPWTEADRRLADTMSAYWVNFARTGDPNAPGLPVWPSYSRESETVLELGESVAPLQDDVPAAAKLEFFDAAYQQFLRE